MAHFYFGADSDELVELVNADVDEATPALSFAHAKAKEKAARAAALDAGRATVEGFRRDVFAASTAAPTSASPRTRTTHARQVKDRLKQVRAVEKVRQKPLTNLGATTQAAQLQDWALEDIDELPVVNRTTGHSL